MALDVKAIRTRYEALREMRSSWEAHWKELSTLFLPTRFHSDRDMEDLRRPQPDSRLINSCGVLSMRTLAAGMQGGMTSPARPWFRLGLKYGEDTPGSNVWLDECTQRMQKILHQSNFYNAAHTLYADLATFGTALMFEVADEDGLRFHVARPGEYVLDIDGEGEVDTFFRWLPMTARQIVDRFGEDKAPSCVKTALSGNSGATTFFGVIHGVFPRKDMVHTAKLGPRAMPFVSVYWMEEEGGAILDEGGFWSFPAFAPRWSVAGGSVYGRGPADDVRADCKMLQAMTTTMRTMQHKLADPPLFAHSALQQFGVDISPGSVNYGDIGTAFQGGQAPVQPIAIPQAQALTATMQAIADVEKVVRDGLYSDLFRMMVDDDRRQITATEIQARQQEKMILIGPVVERLHKELLEPLISRTFELMGQYLALPPFPQEMEGQELEVTFESVLAQAQKLAATSAIDQGWAFAVSVAQADPTALDVVDVDQMVKGYLKRTGMPEGCICEDEAIQQKREARAKAQEQAQREQQMAAMTENIQGLAGAAKDMGQTPVGADGQTLMQTLVGGLGGA